MLKELGYDRYVIIEREIGGEEQTTTEAADQTTLDSEKTYDFGGSISCLSNSIFNGVEFASAWASTAKSANEAASKLG